MQKRLVEMQLIFFKLLNELFFNIQFFFKMYLILTLLNYFPRVKDLSPCLPFR